MDLAKLSDKELVKLQMHKNDWYVREARRLLQERAAAKKLNKDVGPMLKKMFDEEKEVTRKLRALWALYVTEALDEEQSARIFETESESIRAWTVRLLLDRNPSKRAIRALEDYELSESTPSIQVAVAAGLQRLPKDRVRWR